MKVEIIQCLKVELSKSTTKLRPTILQAIINLYEIGKVEFTARVVTEECLKVKTFPRDGRLPAICAGMRKAIECGGRVIGEDRDFMEFTIRFDNSLNTN